MLKSNHGFDFQSPNRYELDLFDEVLYALVGQEAAKNQCSKLEVIYICSKYPYFISYRGLC